MAIGSWWNQDNKIQENKTTEIFRFWIADFEILKIKFWANSNSEFPVCRRAEKIHDIFSISGLQFPYSGSPFGV